MVKWQWHLLRLDKSESKIELKLESGRDKFGRDKTVLEIFYL